MIDTIKLGTDDYLIQSQSSLIKRVDINQATGEIKTKLFYNGDVLNLTIDNRGFRVKYSFPKLYGLQDNFFIPGAYSFKTTFSILLRKLKDLGILIDINTLKVLRLDLCKNVETNYCFDTYSDVLRTLTLKRTHRRDYVDGFLSSNSRRELCFYNKIKELNHNFGAGYTKYKYGITKENIIRGELRFLRHSEVVKHGIKTLIEIPDKWSHLKNIYNEYMRNVFKYDYDKKEPVETFNSLLKLALDLLREDKRILKELPYVIFSFANRDELLNILKIHFSKPQCYYILSKIEKTRRRFELGNYQFKNLYRELKEKFTGG